METEDREERMAGGVGFGRMGFAHVERARNSALELLASAVNRSRICSSTARLRGRIFSVTGLSIKRCLPR